MPIYPSVQTPILSYLDISPRPEKSKNLLKSSKSLSPNSFNSILPQSPYQYRSKLHIPMTKTSPNELRYNPETYLENQTSDSRTRK